MTEKSNRGGVREGAGRKPTPEAEVMKVGTIRLLPAQWAKLARLGGVAWLRKQIDRAREPMPPKEDK